MTTLLYIASIIIMVAGIVTMIVRWREHKSAFFGIALYNLGNSIRLAADYIKEESVLTLVLFVICLTIAVAMLSLEAMEDDDKNKNENK